MGRQIDADALKRLIAGMAISNNYPANKANALCELIDAQPTAYDPDKVVEKLKKDSYTETPNDMNPFDPSEVVNLESAIEIVEGGGVDG